MAYLELGKEMTNFMTFKESLAYGFDSLVIFRRLLNDPVISALSRLCHIPDTDISSQLCCYSELVSALYEKTDCLTDYIAELVLEHEQPCIVRAGASEDVPDVMRKALENELAFLNNTATLPPDAFLRNTAPLALWNTRKINLIDAYYKRETDVDSRGYGIFAKYHMFTVNPSGEIIPVLHPDPVTFDQLVGYERERQTACENILALLDGNFSANVLLSGDAGTGKSATVKAIANTYRDRGLRLIELTKEQLCHIPQIMDRLCKNPLKFILFIDDLTFSEDDPNFGTLKATLEGSISARMKNTVIYATSNRRHLVKETFDDGSDKHENDTIQERISLSERFGITITFQKPQKKLYLEIVQALAKQAGLHMEENELSAKAEQFALCKSGRSARAARQLVDQLLSQQNTEKGV